MQFCKNVSLENPEWIGKNQRLPLKSGMYHSPDGKPQQEICAKAVGVRLLNVWCCMQGSLLLLFMGCSRHQQKMKVHRKRCRNQQDMTFLEGNPFQIPSVLLKVVRIQTRNIHLISLLQAERLLWAPALRRLQCSGSECAAASLSLLPVRHTHTALCLGHWVETAA